MNCTRLHKELLITSLYEMETNTIQTHNWKEPADISTTMSLSQNYTKIIELKASNKSRSLLKLKMSIKNYTVYIAKNYAKKGMWAPLKIKESCQCSKEKV